MPQVEQKHTHCSGKINTHTHRHTHTHSVLRYEKIILGSIAHCQFFSTFKHKHTQTLFLALANQSISIQSVFSCLLLFSCQPKQSFMYNVQFYPHFFQPKLSLKLLFPFKCVSIPTKANTYNLLVYVFCSFLLICKPKRIFTKSVQLIQILLQSTAFHQYLCKRK